MINSPPGICLAATWQGFDAGRAAAWVTDSPYWEGQTSVGTLARRSWSRGLFMGRRDLGSFASWDPTHVLELIEVPEAVATGLSRTGASRDAAHR